MQLQQDFATQMSIHMAPTQPHTKRNISSQQQNLDLKPERIPQIRSRILKLDFKQRHSDIQQNKS
jgi:hypothetical protein